VRLRLRIRPEAEVDLLEACRWYDGQAPGLSGDFLSEIERAFLRIEEQPRMYPVVHRGVRRALVRRFPNGIYYLETGDDGVVLAILHLARDPARLAERLKPK
jgi:plasmid stabilization system protein ParE